MGLIRKGERAIVAIAVTVTTVLDSVDATIVDLSEHGARIVGTSLSKGAKFQIDYMGQTVFAQCMWSEIDRMGVRFPFDLTDGPLHDALMMAVPGQDIFAQGDIAGGMPRDDFPISSCPTLSGRRTSGHFGRRNSA